MIFKVSKKTKGSYVLSSLNKILTPGMTVLIGESDLAEEDVRFAIENEILVLVDKKHKKMIKSITDKKAEVTVVNNTKQVLILGDIVLGPSASLCVRKKELKSPVIIAAKESGIIRIISDEKEITTKQKKASKKVEEIEKVDYVAPKSGEDKNVKPVVWNFRNKEIQDAESVPKSEDVVRIDEKNDVEEVDFVDEKKKKTTKKKTTKKKIAKKRKKTVKKTTKKKEMKKKSKKVVNSIKPVGEEKKPKTVMDAAIELDSRGNPIGDKPSETLQHLIDLPNAPKEVEFADDEQAKDRYNKRTDME